METVMTLSVKLGLSEKHTKFEKIFLMVLTNQLIYLVKTKTMRNFFSNYLCSSNKIHLSFYCTWYGWDTFGPIPHLGP